MWDRDAARRAGAARTHSRHRFRTAEDLPEAHEALRRALEIAESAQADYESALALRAIAWLDGTRTDETATAIFARLGVDESALPQPD